MDSLNNQSFVIRNRAVENKIRFTTLTEVDSEDGHGQVIIQFARALQRLLPEEQSEAKIFTGILLNTIQLHLNTQGGLTEINRDNLLTRFNELAVVLDYNSAQIEELFTTFIYYAQHAHTHGESKKFNYFGYTNYTTSLANIIEELGIYNDGHKFNISQQKPLEFELGMVQELYDSPQLKKLSSALEGIEESDLQEIVYELLMLANTIQHLSKIDLEMNPLHKFGLLCALVGAVQQMQSLNSAIIYSTEELLDLFNLIVKFAHFGQPNSTFKHITNLDGTLQMDCFINMLCKFNPSLNSKKKARLREIEIERTAVLVSAATNLDAKTVRDIHGNNLSIKFLVFWRSFAIFRKAATAEDLFERFSLSLGQSESEDSVDFTLSADQTYFLKQRLKSINVELTLEAIKSSLETMHRAIEARAENQKSIERYIRAGSEFGMAKKKQDILEKDAAKFGGGTFIPGKAMENYVDTLDMVLSLME